MDVGCTDYDIRLINGNTVDPLEGRVEVCINNAWGTVCDTGFSVNDAQVICTQLGHPFNGMFRDSSILSVVYSICLIGVEVFHNAQHGSGSGAIFFDLLSCDGTETSISECSVRYLHSCTHSDDASVQCIG